MALKDWEKKGNSHNYYTWRKKDNRKGNYNVFTLVAKTESGDWVVFLDGQDAGVSVLAYPSSKEDALKFAKNYMGAH